MVFFTVLAMQMHEADKARLLRVKLTVYFMRPAAVLVCSSERTLSACMR